MFYEYMIRIDWFSARKECHDAGKHYLKQGNRALKANIISTVFILLFKYVLTS